MITLSILLLAVADIALVGLAVLAVAALGLAALAIPGIALGGVVTVLVIAAALFIGLGYAIRYLFSSILALIMRRREAAVRVRR